MISLNKHKPYIVKMNLTLNKISTIFTTMKKVSYNFLMWQEEVSHLEHTDEVYVGQYGGKRCTMLKLE